MRRIRANIVGVAVDVVSFEDAILRIEDFIHDGRKHYVCVNSAQDIIIAQKNQAFKEIVNQADLATPDGWPVVWGIRVTGFVQKTRVSGPDLMLAICERGVPRGFSHFFYGGGKEVPNLLGDKLTVKFPGLKVAGKYSPPFRSLSSEEDEEIIERINNSGADILWIGLGTPKQHFWIKDHFGKIKVPVMIAVGAAFDFHSERIRRAPIWMQEYGLEWLHRIFQEPRRLGKRYAEYLPAFAILFTAQLLGIKKYRI
ncbi:MAG: WecB/TagA/CpsF family glycosyltransferase [Candidatus Margulisbacteria bacterium]|nr:WecB/TagA/CpsF family glycosyltransferase [Candidatus Margulisiibacteriota bacterium]